MSESKPTIELDPTSILGARPEASADDLLGPRPDKREPGHWDPAGIATSAGVGGVLGLATPEIMKGAGAAIRAGAPLAGPYAPPVAAFGAGLSAAAPLAGRLIPAIGGAFSGASGEAAGQAVEVAGGPQWGAEAARIGTGVIAQGMLTETIKALIAKAGTAITGMPISSLVGKIASDLGHDPNKLTALQRKAIEDEIRKIPGFNSGSTGEVFQHLERGAGEIERGATVVGNRAEGATNAARQRADAALSEANLVRDRLGPVREPSATGEEIRTAVNNRFSEQSLARNQAYQAQMAERDAAVAAKESAGIHVESDPAYLEGLNDLRLHLLRGKAAMLEPTARTTEQGTLSAYQRIYDAMSSRRVMLEGGEAQAKKLSEMGLEVAQGTDPNTGLPAFYRVFPTSFKALDDVRRKLGDAAFGKQAEGYEALGQSIARDWYGRISEIQSRFAGPSQDLLQGNYELASRLLDKFRARSGARATALDRFDPTKFQTDPSNLPRTYFGSRQGVDDLLALTENPALVNKAAAEYTVRQLEDKSGDAAAAWYKNARNSDWINHPALKETRDHAEQYISRLRAAEEADKLATGAERALPRIRDRAEAEARQRVDLILGSSEADNRVREIIFSGNRKIWDEVGPILARTQAGQAALGKAVGQVLAEKAGTDPARVPLIFMRDVRPSLESRGLVAPQALDALQAQLDRVAKVALDGPAKLHFSQMLVSNFVRSYLGYGAVRAYDRNKPQMEGVILGF